MQSILKVEPSTTPVSEVKCPISVGHLFFTFLLITTATYVLVLAGISHGQLLCAIPTYEDDYRTLAYSIADIPLIACRPFAFYTSFLMGSFGASFTFLAAQAMAIVTIALSFTLVAYYLEVKRLHWPAVLCAVACAVSVEHLADYGRYLAVLFSLYSSIYGLTALIFFVSAFRSNRPKIPLSLAVALTVLGLLCKEEFFGPIICFCIWSSFPVAGERNRHLARLAAIVLVCVSSLILAFEKFILHSPFLGSGEAYSVSLSPVSILMTYWAYFKDCPGTMIAAAASIAAILFSLVLCDRKSTIRLAAIVFVSLLIMAPFSLIPQHFLAIYTLEWTSLQCASLLILCFTDETKLANWSKILLSIFLLALIPFVMLLTNPLRVAKFAWHDNRAAFNAKVVRWLAAHRDKLNNYQVIAVTGLPLGSPWYGNDGAYLKNKLGLNCSWLVLTPLKSELYRAQAAFAQLKYGTIEMKAIETHSIQPDIPLLSVKEDGTIDFTTNIDGARKN